MWAFLLAVLSNWLVHTALSRDSAYCFACGVQHPCFTSHLLNLVSMHAAGKNSLGTRLGQANYLLFCISHFLDLRAGGQSLFIVCYTSKCYRQIYSSSTIKSGRVNPCKVIMTVEAAGLRSEEVGADVKQ